MSDSEDERSAQDSDSSGRQTPVPRSRSPSVESACSTASRRSRTRYTRSRSPVRGDREKEALAAENRALRQQLEELARTNAEQKAEIESLRAQIKTQHEESMSQFGEIRKMLVRTNVNSSSVSEAMEVDQPKKAEKQEQKKEAKENRKEPPPTKKGDKEADAPPEKEAKIPPVILRNKENWNEISKQLKTARIEYTKARLIGEGIQVFPARVEDYRRLTRLLTEGEREYHTYSLPEAKLTRVVIRGLPDGIPLDEVKEDLQEQGFAPVSVQRMKSRRTKRVMPLVLVQVPPRDERIMEVTRCCGLVVRTEPQKQTKDVRQCHRCQRFGHSQSNCSAKPRCVKCGGAHHSGDCKKAPTEPAKCANCDGPHPASYKGCPRFPSKKTGKQKKAAEPAPKPARKQEPPTRQASAQQTPVKPVQKPKSFAEAAKRGAAGAAPQSRAPAAAPATAPSTQDLTAVLAQMQQMCAAMSAFFAKMPALGKV